MTSVKNSRHVAYEQVKTMIDFMGQHIEFATGSLRTLEARHTSKKLWGELTSILNDYRGGTKKTEDGWSKYWSDFKNKLKNKARVLKRQKRGTSMTKTSRSLTKLEKRALIILGPYFEKKPRPNTSDNPLSDVIPEVKLEAYQENNDFFSRQIEDHHDRLSSGEGVSDESVESSDENCEDDGNMNLNDPLIQNLYPKWLIEVEKKRAEADLLRAKAEEKRASAAAKSAEAALLQAEAMRKLADAAVTQSAAISRIAAVLENGHIDDVTSVSSQGQSKSESTPPPGPTL